MQFAAMRSVHGERFGQLCNPFGGSIILAIPLQQVPRLIVMENAGLAGVESRLHGLQITRQGNQYHAGRPSSDGPDT
jgi:hypothetical protein